VLLSFVSVSASRIDFPICGCACHGVLTRGAAYPSPTQPSPPSLARPILTRAPLALVPSPCPPSLFLSFDFSRAATSLSLPPLSPCGALGLGDGDRRSLDPRGELPSPLPLSLFPSPSPSYLPHGLPACAPLGRASRARPWPRPHCPSAAPAPSRAWSRTLPGGSRPRRLAPPRWPCSPGRAPRAPRPRSRRPRPRPRVPLPAPMPMPRWPSRPACPRHAQRALTRATVVARRSILSLIHFNF
jgi:hypothetical protein